MKNSDWKEHTITEVCTLIADCVNRTAPVVDYETEYKMIRTSNIKNGKIDYSDVKYVTSETFEYWNRRAIPRKDDVILTREAPYGEVGINNGKDKIFLGQRLMLYRTDEKKCNAHFLYYSFLSDFCQNQFHKYASGSTVQHIKVPDAKRILIKLPPLPTQQKIADTLGAYDELIENNRRRIALLENIAAGLYKEWFVRMRPHGQILPKNVETGLPEGWEVKKLGEVVEFQIGGGWGNDELTNEFSVSGYVIRGTDIPKVRLGEANKEVYRFHKASNVRSRTLKKGDIVFETAGGSEGQPLGRSTIITDGLLEQYGDIVIAASFCKQIRVQENLSCFFYLYINDLYEKEALQTFAVQSTGISNFQFSDFLKYQQIAVPPAKLLTEFQQKVDDIYNQISNLGTQNVTLRRVRDRLLPRLMSGELGGA